MTTTSQPSSVDFYFDVGSPTAYLAYTQLPAIAQACGASVIYKPMLLGGVFKATGNNSPVSVPAKGRWMGDDIARWARRYGVPFAFNPHFPINTLTLMRGAVAVQIHEPARLTAYLDAVFNALWRDKRPVGNATELAGVLGDVGWSADDFGALVSDPAVKARLMALTDEAVARGVFGAPTCFVGDAMFFGQDRLDFVREALLAPA
jgi:2-hydroxychromene-2-carboxylate isomerase